MNFGIRKIRIKKKNTEARKGRYLIFQASSCQMAGVEGLPLEKYN